jgi:hypothetical protein
MGWVLLFIGLLLPPLIGWLLIRRFRADLALTLLGLASLPVLFWGFALWTKIGPCKVGSCLSSGEHGRLVFAIAALVVLLAAFALIAAKNVLAGGAALVLAEALGAVSLARIDNTATIMIILIGLAAAGYLAVFRSGLARTQTPDYPPAA